VNRYARPLTVGLISASTLAYEILLVRVFGIEYFHHFAYMAIGVAMLGFGVAGTLLAVARPNRVTADSWFVWSAAMTPAALLASAAFVHLIPLDATQLAWDGRQWLRLAIVYLLLALPFAVGALPVLLSLLVEPQRAGRLYGASFAGAGVGAALAIAVLWIALPARALALPPAVASLGALSVARIGRGRALKASVAIVIVLSALAIARQPWRINVTPYKGLPQVEAFPVSRRVVEKTSPIGWVVAVEAPAFRHAPGLSLSYRGEFPRQIAVFVDGDIAGAVNTPAGTREDDILDWLPSATPYALGDMKDVLVLGAGGGSDVRSALVHEARAVWAVELHPELVALARSSVEAEWPSADVTWVAGDARRYVSAATRPFDLVTIGPGRAFGAAVAGVHALNEDFLHTTEAYVDYLSLVSDGGVLSITRWLTIPPRENVRVILTAVEALKRVAPNDLIDKLVVVRSWATATVLVKPAGFSVDEVRALMEWAGERRFDLAWYPGIEGPVDGFNLVDDPILYRAASAAVDGEDARRAFVDSYPFDVEPVGDSRPYPHHFLRFGSVRTFLSDRGSALPFAEWGYVALLATLFQSAVLAAVLLLVPVALRQRVGSRDLVRVVGYFSAIGLAFMSAEIAAIQQLTLLLGHPIYAVAAVLAALLVFSGFGSAWSDARPAQGSRLANLALAILLVVYAAVLLWIARWLQPAALAVRVAAAVVVLVPTAFLMGMPFPLGLRHLARGDGERVAWAWASNGFASVVAAPLSALVALQVGSRALLLVAALAYAGAAIVVARAGNSSFSVTARSRAPG
jgi:hypothetical protein